MTSRQGAVMIAAALATATLLHAQAPQRDAPAQATTGPCAITGRIMTNDARPTPVRFAKVTLSTGGGPNAPMTTTDENGDFAFRHLPPGRYQLSAAKAGFVPATYGAKRPGGIGTPVIVSDATPATIAMTLTRGGVITGTVRGPDGSGVAHARLHLFSYEYSSSGERTLQPEAFSNSENGSLVTDDRGSYRIYGIRPGEYDVAVDTSISNMGGQLVTSSAFDWAQQSIAALTAPASPPPPLRQVTLAPVFYPGVTDPTAATPIVIAGSEEHAGIDMTFTYVPTATIHGKVVDPAGLVPKIAQVTLLRPSMPFGIGGTYHLTPDASGAFTAANVVPGDYILAARGSAHDSDTAATGPGGEASMPLLWLSTLTVSGQDIDGLEVKLAPGASVSGRLTLAGTGATPPLDFSTLTVTISATETRSGMAPPAVRANADGTFAIHGVGPGKYRLTASGPDLNGPSARWALKSSTVNGVDALEAPLEIGASDISGAEITLTDQVTELTGSLVDGNGQPAPEYVILLFSTDTRFWTPLSRHIRYARPASTGNFKLTGFPPGEYYVCALTDLEPNRIYTAEYLKPIAAQAIKITFGDGEKKVQDFRIAGGSRGWSVSPPGTYRP